MNVTYDFHATEEKWQRRWEEEKQSVVTEDPGRPEYYVLEMLPYPSGALHMGHVRNYSLGDSIARFKRMQGFNVLHPLGWDAFGLPAENAAIRNRVPPDKWTRDNIRRMKEQSKRMGWSYDWTREIATCDPEYYRWNQWFFIQMYKRGLAFKKEGPVNWCEQCQTVLANEQVRDGSCWRDGSLVVEKELDQWYWRTTAYVEDLLAGLDELDTWPEKVLTMQRNWIGRSEGAQVRFQIAGTDDSVEVFTTRLDTIFGATFVVLAPEHELSKRWQDDSEKGREISSFSEGMRSQTKAERTGEAGEKKGVFTGRYAINPYSGEEVPVYVANFVLMEYGTYRTLNILTDLSFRVRLAHVTYVDTSGEDDPFTRYAFLIEDDEMMALRNGGRRIDWTGGQLDPRLLEKEHAILVDVFQYMIGNTDWSGVEMHNMEVFQTFEGVPSTIPFDFDFSGLVNTRYATPDPSLDIRRVRQRLFRGFCPDQVGRTPEEYEAAYAYFKEKKEEIYEMWRGMEGLEEDRLKDTLEYFDEFYETLDDPGRIESRMMRACRRLGD